MSEKTKEQAKDFLASYKALCIRHEMHFGMDYDGELWHMVIERLHATDKADLDRISIADYGW